MTEETTDRPLAIGDYVHILNSGMKGGKIVGDISYLSHTGRRLFIVRVKGKPNPRDTHAGEEELKRMTPEEAAEFRRWIRSQRRLPKIDNAVLYPPPAGENGKPE